ncbi:DUF4826 family protein [Haloferula sp. BvORR071]|uniref:DUF4826 family protein n=1 Tax=Haloferula sp. BvORR071 TaxID=1396141 RepID=UPI002240F941|nr:DUF4826 family protein [Haloferula sp. BvORR071]
MRQQHEVVVNYLQAQGCEHGGVATWPAFHLLDPHLALWAVQSVTTAGKIGWWAISGDLPTDYMSSSSGYHPRDAMRHFSREWLDVAAHMREGREHPRTKIGRPELWPTMAPILEKRTELLQECADDEDMWDGY